MIKIQSEEGSAVVEFISLICLLIMPVLLYFTLVTVKASSAFKEDEILREVSEIVKSTGDFHESKSLAQRYISLQGGKSSLSMRCVAGDCPHRGSVMMLELRTAGRITHRTVLGGNWQ